MIFVDVEDALELLREHGIQVGAARVVGSVEDASAFAARHPIDLYAFVPFSESHPGQTIEDLHGPDSIGEAYRRLERYTLGAPKARIVARRAVPAGTDVVIDARHDPALGRIVEIRSGAHVASRPHPLAAHRAEAMLEEFHTKHGIASNEARTRMLAHLLERVSGILDDGSIDRLTLDPVRVHGNSYHVLGVRATAKRPLGLNRRLAPHAHDRKGHYAPSGG